ncbi:SDR family NAD(P)-dependent oxidoreductase [Streptomyces lavendulae]|uniref:SDR family NAD(P)-dependent oxidoreductase n=1 Tax=Streptomyces lavendulae TaxID=1914 RepID=UPI0024A4F667|nr:3-oxoacyl-ACP reductase family protein [Streptomyces lavendulae]GLX17902.1 beta-ketoacyl-ACP reductase [Streptomyces lavendulae subsp. lavendulae]GLX26246.1 beta-ketoacyl-ACP reductase [Streptomyces lavendulae subsp. lavendulae]
MTLEGRVALVTGSSRGIGRAIALRLAADGAAIAVNYRSRKDEAERVVEEITSAGGRAIPLQADVSDPEAAQRLVRETIDGLGGLHVLVNNAGVAQDGLIYDQAPADWWEVLKVNVGGVYNCTHAVAGHFMSQCEGNVINISSVMGEGGWVGQSNYSASKGAVNSFTRAAAIELARFEIRVNAVLAGYTATDLIGGLLEKDGGKNIKRQLPFREFATPEQVAGVVSFLAGEDSSYVTGELLRVDGGWAGQLGLGRSK